MIQGAQYELCAPETDIPLPPHFPPKTIPATSGPKAADSSAVDDKIRKATELVEFAGMRAERGRDAYVLAVSAVCAQLSSYFAVDLVCAAAARTYTEADQRKAYI